MKSVLVALVTENASIYQALIRAVRYKRSNIIEGYYLNDSVRKELLVGT